MHQINSIKKISNLTILLFTLFLIICCSINVTLSISNNNPFTPRAYLLRYWTQQIHNSPTPHISFISKASPLTTVDSANFAKLAAGNSLATHLATFCSAANLLCFPDLNPSLEKHDAGTEKFAVYSGKNFTNYGTDGAGGLNSFKNYSNGDNMPLDSFRRYSRDAAGRDDSFSSYGIDGNVADQSFNTYGVSATGGTGEFDSYEDNINVPNLKFTSYGNDGNGRNQGFTSYTKQGNSGQESFSSYGKNENGPEHVFTSYGESSNVIQSDFNGYGENGNGANTDFKKYGFDSNVPENKFNSYGEGGNAEVSSFTSYREQSNVGDDDFKSYAKGSNSAKVNFVNYGKSFNEGTDTFSGYGKGAQGQSVGFKTYGVNNTFKDYEKKDSIKFSEYSARTSSDGKVSTMAVSSGKMVNRWVEPGKFFREALLKEGTVMPMPDIQDKMPKRSFLPRVISSKLPFATSKLAEMKMIFHAADNSTMEKMFLDALADCERTPSRGETKRCVGSGEDMIDFATSVLGRKITVRTTNNTNGSGRSVMVGSVKGINGGKVTKSVSCHQSLFPYLLYYCHSVPEVRVYEAELLDPNSKSKINHGVAICHLDTSAWSPTHGAFLALGSGPGKIEVCHWIFENDMTWTIAN